MENFSLSNENIAEIKSKLTAMTIDYTDDNFEVVYDTKSSIDSAMIEYTNLNAMDNLDTLMTEKGIVYTQATCPYSGIVSLTTDDYSDITYDAITEEDLDKSKYIASTIQSGSLVEAGSAVYKIVDSENWSIVFKLDDDDIERFSNKNSLSIDISGSNLTASGSYMQFTGKDNNTYGMISLSRYMVDFISQRYLTFSINDGSESGLKIPQKAITEKSFFIVPISYLARGGDNIDEGFYKEIYNEQGTSIQYVPTTIFYSDEEYYYIDNTDKSEFKAGDYIIQPNTNERYQIGQIASLEGVYNINKGYAVFKQIDIISSNDEYCIVKRNTKYGLSVYDHILIDTTGISEGDFIYE